ncbi:alpha/beta fold hydrolase [Streptomonospora sp. PA3]|uniref:alpha/beta fold hydrolase n=1 Tax=Streptomonospora sp. PA3 TaxID=2607326 RepID=UPI0012DFA801|nr:alpha/beta fold hydrolase [Streptomonospora sp. PA3]MUL40575.1 alpha/beta fold hydrolase [Streptomonospora sp. PA3]
MPTAAPAPRRTLAVRSADGTRLHAEVHGPAHAPPVILAHGWTCAIRLWHPLIHLLGENLRLICYDQRGHGASQAPRAAGYGTTALADDLIAVMDAALEPGERAVVAGHSMGAMTVMAAAERPRFAARTAAALLASTGAGDLTASSRVFPGAARFPRAGALAHRMMLTAPLPLGPRTRLTRAALHYATMAKDAQADMVDLCADMVHAAPALPRARWGRVLAGLDLRRNLRTLQAPTLVVAGTDDRLTPIAHARRIAEALPDCRGLVELPRTGHMTPLETPAALAQALSDLARTHLAPSNRQESA